MALLAGAPAFGAEPVADRPAAERPIVVELFTSQGCSSCPPADALLGELARRSDVLALGFHVDYWNRLGWQDPYSSAAATQRQHTYARWLDSATVYTPQMVIDGRIDVVGSYRDRVLRAIDRARAAAVTVPIGCAAEADGVRVRVAGADPALGRATLWLIGYDRHHETVVGAGENGGRTLAEWQIVRGIEPLGAWTGAPYETTVPTATLARYERTALVLQADGGRILGATLAPSRP
ncbi:MAG TPA: DUF1223 domain-containing protein [Candidatus Sulfotelmatobacter sp.]|nr:DUF1223 domain-containing protein [Candidatus Sulfotelmatobacter sp.]